MSFAAHRDSFVAWMDGHMMKGSGDVPARLLTLLGLLERLREVPELNIDKHKAGSGMQLVEHNGFVDKAIARFGVVSPVQEKGRRSNNLHAHGPTRYSTGFATPAFRKDKPAGTMICCLGHKRRLRNGWR